MNRASTIAVLLIRGAVGLCAFALAIAIGCASSSSKSGAGKTTPIATSSSKGVTTDNTLNVPVVRNPSGTTGSVAVRAVMMPLGQVPYDNLSLPMVSPDGQFVATETGIAPTWETIIGAADSSLPELTRIEIYRLDRRETVPDNDRRQDPQLQLALQEPALLGRSCDREGFLIESPRQDGSRWIGKVSWSTGAVNWLVKDQHVNAFASLGPDGRLAWARRTPPAPMDVSGVSEADAKALATLTAGHFDLVVRTRAGEWILPRTLPDDNWVMPFWCNRDDRLFVMHLTADGVMEAVYANAASAASFRQSIQRFKVSSSSSVSTAYQSLCGTIGMGDGPPPVMDQLVYYHPALNRAAFWRPLGPSNRKSMFLNPDSITAVLDELDLAIVVTDKLLIRQSLASYSQRITLTHGTVIPRPTWASDWSYVLLSPLEGAIGISAMKLLPVDAKAPMGKVQ